MSTRSTIGIENKDKTITVVYCHSDGYIEHHGPILLKHYNAEAKVRALLKQGDISSLGATIGKKHSFDERNHDMCTFYKRDRAEKDVDARILVDPSSQAHFQEYNYVFRLNGTWQVNEGEGWQDLVPETVAAKLA